MGRRPDVDRSSVPDPGSRGEHLATVSIPAVVGVVGPDVLASTPMTIVALGQRSLWVEGPTALTPGETVAVACWLPNDRPGDDVAPVLAVATVSGRPGAGPGSRWRSPLEIEQIDGADSERLSAVAIRADFRGGHR
jgi:hypothetical protein